MNDEDNEQILQPADNAEAFLGRNGGIANNVG
jgi:hypothetical protein